MQATTKAEKMLLNSLEYLKKEPLPDTEMATRISLMNILVNRKAPPEEIFAIARPLAVFKNKLGRNRQEAMHTFLNDAMSDDLSSKIMAPALKKPGENSFLNLSTNENIRRHLK